MRLEARDSQPIKNLKNPCYSTTTWKKPSLLEDGNNVGAQFELLKYNCCLWIIFVSGFLHIGFVTKEYLMMTIISK